MWPTPAVNGSARSIFQLTSPVSKLKDPKCCPDAAKISFSDITGCMTDVLFLSPFPTDTDHCSANCNWGVMSFKAVGSGKLLPDEEQALTTIKVKQLINSFNALAIILTFPYCSLTLDPKASAYYCARLSSLRPNNGLFVPLVAASKEASV